MNTEDRAKTPASNDGAGRRNPHAYRDGYVYGRDVEHQIQTENRTIRENNSAAKGLLIGISITAIAGLLGATIFFLTQQNRPSTRPVQVVPVPNSSQPQAPTRQTTVIERTVETTRDVAPAPQQSTPDQTAPTSQSPATSTQPEATQPNTETEAPDDTSSQP